MGALRPWARYVLLVVAYLLAMGLGAVVLQALEGPPALQLQTQLQAELATFQAEYGACLTPGALQELLGVALRAQAHGVSSLGNSSEASNWDLPSALLFTASILTTTGKAARQPSRNRLLRPWLPEVPGGAALPPTPKPQTQPSPIWPDITTEAPHTNTPQLVPPLQLPEGVWPPQAPFEIQERCSDL